jgi:pimeloyl-ACP methyl ester carboxylesterase
LGNTDKQTIELSSDQARRSGSDTRSHARAFLLVAAILGLLAVSSPSIAAAGSSRASSPSPITAPTTTTYTVGGRPVTMVCQGTGSVPVVFQAGGDDPGARWDPLVAALGPDVLTCVFDRPGVGASAPHPAPLTPRGVAKTLAAVLKQAHIGRRVVLVGHSIGGLNALVFGAAYPKNVAGAVLFDPSEAAFFQATHAESILESYGSTQRRSTTRSTR